MKTIIKIIATISYLIIFAFLIYIGIMYLRARAEFDDEGMFIYGFDFMIAGMFYNLLFFMFLPIMILWSKEPKKRRKKNETSNRIHKG